jgi:polysaccharide export outer membrane protein
MRTVGPVAVAPGGDLDAMAYGQSYRAPATAVADNSGGGAISALRNAMNAPRTYTMAAPMPTPRPVAVSAPMPVGYAAAPMPVRHDAGYRLDAGDKLRVVVYGQEGLTNTYTIDAAGSITMPLIGQVPARGRSPASLAAEIAGRLRNGFIREPSVAVEIESYRPFFILGEVQAPGQYPYVPNMTVESAVAIAGGFSPRAFRGTVRLRRNEGGQIYSGPVPLGFPVRPGDTITIQERWF